jgi:VanZ family protein
MTPSISRRALLWLPPLVYMAVIYYLSSQPNPVPRITEHVWDKLLHLVEYGALAALRVRAMLGEGAAWRSAFWVAIVATSAYGASDELHQSFVPLRNADAEDWLVDTVGAVLGTMACRRRGARPMTGRANTT